MQVDSNLLICITENTVYLTRKPQSVRMMDCISETSVSSKGAPQEAVFALFLLSFNSPDFTYNLESSRSSQMTLPFWDESRTDRKAGTGRSLVEDFVAW